MSSLERCARCGIRPCIKLEHNLVLNWNIISAIHNTYRVHLLVPALGPVELVSLCLANELGSRSQSPKSAASCILSLQGQK